MIENIEFDRISYQWREDKYVFSGKEEDSVHLALRGIVQHIFLNYLSSLNDMQFATQLGKNYGFLIFESYSLIFKMYTTKFINRYYPAVEGIIFCNDDLSNVWLNLCELMELFLSEKETGKTFEITEVVVCSLREEYSLQKILLKQTKEYIRNDFLPKSFVCTNLSENIWFQEAHIFQNGEKIKTTPCTEIHLMEWQEYLKLYREKYRREYSDLGNVAFEYELPSMKNRSKEDGYFAERKQIKSDIRQGKLYWKIHTICNNKHYVRKLTVQLDKIPLDRIKNEFELLGNRIRGDFE